MQRYRILHRTYYNFSGLVTLNTHELRLRPREGHELRIETSVLNIEPVATLRWHRDAEDNSVAIAGFNDQTSQLVIECETVIQQYNENPFDFLVSDYAVQYPFQYLEEDRILLAPYLGGHQVGIAGILDDWLASFWNSNTAIQTYALMQVMCSHIHQTLNYQGREEPGVQSPDETLARGSGSCRDFAHLFMAGAQRLGLAARFVSGYLHAPPSWGDFGATHAWAEVYIPGAGWKGFDPTIGQVAATSHIAVAVARLPESVPPVAGSFVGPTGANLSVGVWVTELA